MRRKDVLAPRVNDGDMRLGESPFGYLRVVRPWEVKPAPSAIEPHQVLMPVVGPHPDPVDPGEVSRFPRWAGKSLVKNRAGSTTPAGSSPPGLKLLRITQPRDDLLRTQPLRCSHTELTQVLSHLLSNSQKIWTEKRGAAHS